MSKIKILTSAAILALSSCTSNGTMLWANDPDGDGNSKGHDHHASYMDTNGKKLFVFDPKHRSWAAYNEKGTRVNTGKGSGGKNWCADVGRSCKTKEGTYQIVREGNEHCKSSKYPIKTNGGAPMPYCMHFGHTGYAIHASNDVPDDRNASHGCVRVTLKSAKWLNEKFIDVGTTVVILPYED